MTDLGNLQRVDPRTVWKHEAHDFTPWLATHIDELGEVLGLDLEVIEQEAGVGDFSADIIAKDLGRDRLVVIENQLEATDHSHLGQLITYAAGREAGLVVWVAREFREEHRQALDWMNRGSSEGTEYFGVAVELLQVDNSKPALNFKLIAAPNEWRRSSSRTRAREGVTDKGAAYQKFFQALIDELRERHHFTNAHAGQPQNWYQFRTGVNGFVYAASFATKGRLRTEVYIDLKDADANERALEFLKASRADIEKDFGEALSWEDLQEKRACRVACYRPGTIEDPDEELEKYRAWVVDRLLKFKRVFGPRLQAAIGAATNTTATSTAGANGG
jgi:Domain of unknown function (DUF4268)